MIQVTSVAPRSPTARGKLSALCAALVLSLPALACGPDFPMTLLDRRAQIMGALPEGVFDFEIKHLLAKPDDALIVVEGGWWDEPNEARAKADALGLSATQVQALAAMRGAASADQALSHAADLPRDVALYTAGALAFTQDDFPAALTYFQAVSALPDAERSHRGLWASFMEGRVQRLNGDAAAATDAFERTRSLARAGSSDPLGLAVASLGEQARLLREGGDVAGAVRLYAQQAAYGSNVGFTSLLFVARGAVNDPIQIDALLADQVGTKLLLAYLYSRYNELIEIDPEAEYQDFNAPADGPRLLSLLDRIAAAPSIPAPDKVAAIAYRAGRFEQAAKLAGQSQSALAAWVRAKLALRAGNTAAAAQAYAAAAQGFPAEESWGEVPLGTGDDYYLREQLKPRCRVQAEAGTLALSRGDYVQALELLFAAAEVYWTDAAYVAERVVTVDELKAMVDRLAPQAIVPPPSNPEDAYEDSYQTPPPANQLRALLARRLLREGRLDLALNYFDDPATRDQAARYIAARGATDAWTRTGQARAWFEAAEIARWHGMEIMGYEGDPDYFSWGGSFDLNSPITYDEDYNPVFNARSDLIVAGPYTSDGERQRLGASRAQPLERFHYRIVAAGHAGQAADLLPARSQAFAAVLCEGTRWLVDRQPETAQTLYRRYLHEGALVPWGASFGRQCPEPNFDKVEAELRAATLRSAGRWAAIAAPIIALFGALWWWRRRRPA